MSNLFDSLASELSIRSARSLLSYVGPANASLRQHLHAILEAPPGAREAFLAPPVFEPLFEWDSDPMRFEELPFIEPSLIQAMDAPPAELQRYRFGRDRHPYKHQRRAWETLLSQDPKSVIVSTGTASGKTECFLVPILSALAAELRESMFPLEGVRALFLYPLNALINSQRDRLAAWCAGFKGGLRFCLYNGNTRHEVNKAEQDRRPFEVLSRKGLRESPPPIVVTNATMLEYMLLRSKDAPIVDLDDHLKSGQR